MLHEVEPPTEFVETLSLNVTLNSLLSSDAIATMLESLANKYAARGALAVLPIELPRLVRPVGLLWLRGHSPGDPAFIECLERAARELVGP